MAIRKNASINAAEVAHFSRYASEWWNPDGALRPLHRLNPARIAYVRDQVVAHKGGGAGVRQPLKGLALLDVGCGGGLLTEPLARLGAKVTGLDASADAIAEARRHAAACGVDVTYKVGSAEDHAEGSARYDVITALEIIEHVGDLDSFIASLAGLLKPDGLLILSTLNRTPKSFLLGIVAAEYLLRWVPRGTHRWSAFLRPSELVQKLESENLLTTDLMGLVYQPLTDSFALRKNDLGMNYMLTARKTR